MGVHGGEHSVEDDQATKVGIAQQGLFDGGHVGHAGGLDDHSPGSTTAPAQVAQQANQIVTHGTARTSGGALQHFLIGRHHQVGPGEGWWIEAGRYDGHVLGPGVAHGHELAD